ncbi:MAG: hypothetical protein IMY68_01550, partial [Bacteroidetes bacterium]|nr:hypothetical protein [Bacteroidota bacterium]
MKTRFFLMLIIMIHGFSSEILAKEPGERIGKNRGLVLGLSASNFAGPEAATADNKFIPGLCLGFYQDFIFNHRYSLETGLFLTSKGSRLNAVGDLYIHQVQTYLEVPLIGECKLYSGE